MRLGTLGSAKIADLAGDEVRRGWPALGPLPPDLLREHRLLVQCAGEGVRRVGKRSQAQLAQQRPVGSTCLSDLHAYRPPHRETAQPTQRPGATRRAERYRTGRAVPCSPSLARSECGGESRVARPTCRRGPAAGSNGWPHRVQNAKLCVLLPPGGPVSPRQRPKQSTKVLVMRVGEPRKLRTLQSSSLSRMRSNQKDLRDIQLASPLLKAGFVGLEGQICALTPTSPAMQEPAAQRAVLEVACDRRRQSYVVCRPSIMRSPMAS